MNQEAKRATPVLARLYAAIANIAGVNLRPGTDVGSSTRAERRLVDADGQIIGLLAVDPGEDVSGATREVLDALVDAYDFVVNAEVVARRATETAQSARRDAHTDYLTGVLNRRAWDLAVGHEQARSERNQSRPAIAVIDLDELKVTNDEQGHLAGDLLLRQAGRLLGETFRAADVVARIGGDEFAVLVVDYTDTGTAALTDRIRRALYPVGIQASVGAAIVEPGANLHQTFKAADQAMYADKQSRRRAGPS